MLPLFLMVVFGGAVQQSITGFGFGIFAISLLPLFMGVRMATAVLSILSVAMNLQLTARYRRNVDWGLLLPTVVASFAGQTVSIQLLFSLSERALRNILGILLIAFALFFALARQRLKLKRQMGTSLAVGLLSGLLNIFNVGGPPTVLYYYLVARDKERYLGTLQCTFLITSLYGLGLHLMRRNITIVSLQYSALGMLAMIPGTWLGGRLFKICSREKVGVLIYTSIALLGMLQLVT